MLLSAFCSFETGACIAKVLPRTSYVTRASVGFKLLILVPQPPEGWDYRIAPSCLDIQCMI